MQEPTFFNRHVLEKLALGTILVPSGIVISKGFPAAALLQAISDVGVEADERVLSMVAIGVLVLAGGRVAVGKADWVIL